MCTCPCPSTLKASALWPLGGVGNAEVDMRMAVNYREMAGASAGEEKSLLTSLVLRSTQRVMAICVVDTSNR